jgi:hypothetical protein
MVSVLTPSAVHRASQSASDEIYGFDIIVY